MKKTLLLFCLGLSMQSLTASASYSFDKSVNHVSAVADGTQWTDFAASSFEGGEGTAESPYLIKTPEQLAKLAKDVYDGTSQYENTYFKLVADIDLAGHDWFPIGYNCSVGEENVIVAFSGKVDGDGHKITNLTIPGLTDYKSMGMFGCTDPGFELRNLTIESGSITGDMVVGPFVGSNSGIIENCVNKVDISCVYYYAGGIVGSNYREGVIRQCVNYGDITAGSEGGNGMSAGGVAGTCYSLIEECANFGDVKAMTNGAGGVIGLLDGGVIRNCLNTGKVSGPERLGGIIGDALGRGDNCELYNCYNVGAIDGNSTLGGIMGLAMFQNFNTLKMHDMYFSSDVFAGSSCGEVTDIFGAFEITNAPVMTSEQMKAEDFVTTLNNGSGSEDKIWAADTKNINNGFPILSFMESIGTGIASPAFNDNINVYAADNRIVVEGADGEMMQVYTVGGQMVYSGKASDISSKPGLFIVRINNNSYKVLVK